MKKHLGQTPSVREYTERLAPVATASCAIDPALYEEYGVKRGLRDKNGKGVLAGLTTSPTSSPRRKSAARRSPAKASCTTAGTTSTASSAAS